MTLCFDQWSCTGAVSRDWYWAVRVCAGSRCEMYRRTSVVDVKK